MAASRRTASPRQDIAAGGLCPCRRGHRHSHECGCDGESEADVVTFHRFSHFAAMSAGLSKGTFFPPTSGRIRVAYGPVSNLHSAPLPSFCLIALGSIVHRRCEMLSWMVPAAPSEGAPASTSVA
jgi:hypothetical protein